MTAVDVTADLKAAGCPAELVDELLESFTEAKIRFYRGDHRPNAIEGGRFSEAAFRLLQWEIEGKYTPVGKNLPSVDKLLVTLQNGTGSESARLHIPRTLRLIYDVRNKRDNAHLADGIDPNLQDATLVVRNMEWVLAELVRKYSRCAPADALAIIEDIVSRELPVIQLVDGFPRVLPTLQASDYCLVLLYWRGAAGATYDELESWCKAPMRSNLRRTLRKLDERNYVHFRDGAARILAPGERYLEQSGIFAPSS